MNFVGMPKMDSAQLDALEQLAAQASPGPWIVDKDLPYCFIDTDSRFLGFTATRNPYAFDNAAYIVAACNAVPELIARVRELERQREALAGKVSDYANRSDDIGNCSYCDFSGYCGDNTTFCSDAIIRWAEEAAKEAEE